MTLENEQVENEIPDSVTRDIAHEFNAIEEYLYTCRPDCDEVYF